MLFHNRHTEQQSSRAAEQQSNKKKQREQSSRSAAAEQESSTELSLLCVSIYNVCVALLCLLLCDSPLTTHHRGRRCLAAWSVLSLSECLCWVHHTARAAGISTSQRTAQCRQGCVVFLSYNLHKEQKQWQPKFVNYIFLIYDSMNFRHNKGTKIQQLYHIVCTYVRMYLSIQL